MLRAGSLVCAVLAAVSMIFSLCSCGHPVNHSSVNSSTISEVNDITIELTDAQKEFLMNNMMDTESIERGQLKDWQIKLLKEYDYCIEYLSGKYEGHNFEVTTYDRTNPSFTKFVVIPDKDEDKVFTVNVFNEEGKFSANDTYVQRLL